MTVSLHFTGDDDADKLLAEDAAALLVGMLLDQQFPMERAFAGPKKIADRMDGFDAARIAGMDADEFEELCATPPGVHRYARSMAKRIQALCQAIIDDYDGDATAIWTREDPDGAEVFRRLKALPGYGEQKAKIFLALLGKQLGVERAGWREVAGHYGDPEARRSIADVTGADSLAEVRAFKKAQKAAAKK